MNIQINFEKSTGRYICTIDGNKFRTKKKDYVEYMYKKITGEKKTFDEISGQQTETKSSKYDINQRFEFVESLVNMIASDLTPSAVITGEGGLGKTYTVNKTLLASGLKDASDLEGFEVGGFSRRNTFVSIKGYSTPKGLYRALYENRNSVIVFDDCDSILKDPVALNLLKSALDSYGKRVISWMAEGGFGRDDELPRSFEFKGRVIFISNMSQDKIDQAIRSRSMMIDLSMNDDQKIQRMETIAMSNEFMPEFESSFKQDALDLIRALKADVREISLRTLMSVTKIRASGKSNWKDMATYILCN